MAENEIDLFDVSSTDFVPDKPTKKVRNKTIATNQYICMLIDKGIPRKFIIGTTFQYRYKDGTKKISETVKITKMKYETAMKWRKEQWV